MLDGFIELQTFWFLILGALLTGYALLDGFDLGVGVLHLGTRNDTNRRILMNAIGPIWDGNEVWLVTFGGALFAAFPMVYATAFSGFYTAFMLLLCALIFRAVSLEFRSKMEWPWWRTLWDFGFAISSTLAAFLFGVAIGNAIVGLPIDAQGEYAGTFLDLLQPYALLVGCLVVALFTMHGAMYLYLKTEGQLQQRVKNWMWKAFGFFLILYILTTIYTLQFIPRATENFPNYPWSWGVVLLNVLAIANIPRAIHLGHPYYAFFSSCCTIIAFNILLAFALYPNMLVSSINPAYSLDIYNASSSLKTLGIMQIIALLGMPIVLTYTALIYWTFRGKVRLDKFSY